MGSFASGRGLMFLLLLVVVVWFVSGFYRVQPDEQGVVLRFGAYTVLDAARPALAPALAGRKPWNCRPSPASTAPRSAIRSGAGGNVEAGRDTSGRDVLAESLMLTGDENIIDIDVAVFWRINNAPDFLFNTANPETLVRGVAESSMREVIGRTPIQPALTHARARSKPTC